MADPEGGRVAVIVTGVGGGGFGEQILKALRLAQTSYDIIGTDTSPLSKGFAAVDHPYVVPPASDTRYVDALLTLARRHGAKALFPGSEPELRVVARRREILERTGMLVPVNPLEVLDTCLDKDRTMRFLALNGFCVPRTVPIEEESQLDTVDFFPAVLKPHVGGGGSADVLIAQDRSELLAFGRYLLANRRTLVVQEYVGTPDSEFTVGILTSMTGELINSIAVRRFTTSALGNRVRVPNRTGRTELGDELVISSGVSQGEIGPFPEVTGPCERMSQALGARGPLNIQCRYVDGQVQVFEINPRFSGTTSLRALVGYNEPDVLVREHVLGQRVQRKFPYRSGVILRGLEETLVTVQHVPSAIDPP
jgi:carbamoyl-phosphate synthase large subunit